MKKISSLTTLPTRIPSGIRTSDLELLLALASRLTGGEAGQMLTKVSDAPLDVYWSDGITIAPGEFCPGYLFTQTTSNSITSVSDIDLTALFSVGRRVRISDSTDKYGVISSSVYGTGTVVTFTMEDSATIVDDPTEICLRSSTTSWVPITADPFEGTRIVEMASGQVGSEYHTVAIGDGGKVFYSTDAGITWTAGSWGNTTDLIQIEYNPNGQVFICLSNSTAYSGWKYSPDGGATWSNMGNPQLNSGSAYPVTRLWMQGSSIYRNTTNYVNGWSSNSPSSSASQSSSGQGPQTLSRSLYQNYSSTHVGFFYETNTGALGATISASWLSTAVGYLDNSKPVPIGAQFHKVAHNPLVSKILVGDGGTLFRSANLNDLHPTSWAIGDSKFGSNNIYCAAYGDNVSTYVIAGQNGTIAYSLDQGVTFTIAVSGFNVTDDIISMTYCDHPTTPVFIAGSANGVICRSTNGIT